MNILKQITISAGLVLVLTPSSAQSSDPTPASSATSFFGGKPVSSAAQGDATTENQATQKESASREHSFKSMQNVSTHARQSRVKNLSIGPSQKEIFARNDRAYLTLYAPTPAVNRSFSFIKTISNSQMDSAWITIIQALSMASTRQVNTEFTYSVPVSKNSKFDSAISYQLGPVTDSGKPGMVASLRYNSKF